MTAFFLADDWLISVHELPFDSFEEVRKRVLADAAGTLGRGVDTILYMLADALVDRQFPILDDFNEHRHAK